MMSCDLRRDAVYYNTTTTRFGTTNIFSLFTRPLLCTSLVSSFPENTRWFYFCRPDVSVLSAPFHAAGVFEIRQSKGFPHHFLGHEFESRLVNGRGRDWAADKCYNPLFVARTLAAALHSGDPYSGPCLPLHPP